MEFQTHRPTGQASFPIVTLAAVQGGGKTWAAAQATALDYFGRSFFLEIGEQMANEYGNVPGASYEIIEHDGTYQQILAACEWAARQEQPDGKAGVMIVDSITEIWQMLSDEQQAIANARRSRGKNGEAAITVDQWNVAKDRMNDVMDALRSFPGLVVVTARLDNVTVMDGNTPTGDKTWKIRAEKNLPFYSQVIMEARTPRQWTMTKVANTALQMPAAGYEEWPDFTIEELMIRMELDGKRPNVAPRNFRRADPHAVLREQPSAQTAARQEAQQAQTAVDTSGLPALPDNLQEVVAELEAALDKESLLKLYAIAKDRQDRIAMARTTSAGKRVAQRLDAGEKPAPKAAPEPAAEEKPELTDDEQFAQFEAAEAARIAALEVAAQDAAAEQPDTAPADTEEAAPEPAAAPAPAEPEPSADDIKRDAHLAKVEKANAAMREAEGKAGVGSKAVAITAEMVPATPDETPADAPAAAETAPEPAEQQQEEQLPDTAPIDKATGKPVAVTPDAEKDRMDTPRRRGVLKAMQENWGDKTADLVYGEFGLEVEDVATKRLMAFYTEANKVIAGTAG